MIKLGELVMILDLHRARACPSAPSPGRSEATERPSGIISPKGWSRRPTRKRAPSPGVVDRFEPYLRERPGDLSRPDSAASVP